MTDLQTLKDERWWAIRAIISEVVMQNASGDDATDQIVAIVPTAITALIERVERAAERAEAAMLQVIDERDEAEEALSQAYYLVTGRSPEWSNLFGHAEALTDIEDACDMLRLAARTKLGLGQ